MHHQIGVAILVNVHYMPLPMDDTSTVRTECEGRRIDLRGIEIIRR
jgi:hypothetical protein